MKKILSLFSVLIMFFCLCSCKKTETPVNDEEERYINGVWISYIEVDGMIKSGDFKGKFSDAVKKCKDFKITDIFFHTVPFCDAYYNSEYYPKRNAEYTNNSDLLEYAVSEAHKNGIKIHAWINPYRVKTADSNVDTLDKKCVAYKWLCDSNSENDKNILKTENGIYLNPAEPEVRYTVLNVVRELCFNYDIDGIHFDDYFYPSVEPEIDNESYSAYLEGTENPLPLENYRCANVNALISGCYSAIKFIDKDIVFSVSPAADIEKNKGCFYADIESWCKSGCVDLLIPQMYFGFDYPIEKFRFNNLLNDWKNILRGTETKLCVGLGFYKTGTTFEPDCEEWKDSDDILSRQTEICITDCDIKGQIYYSYSSLFSDAELNIKAREKVSAVIDSNR